MNAYSMRSSGKAVIDIKVTRAKVSIPTDGIDVTVHGNYFGHLAGPFRGLFKKELATKVEAELEKLLRTSLPQALNKQVEDAQTQLKVSDIVKFDSHLADFPLGVVDGWLHFGLKGFSVIGNDSLKGGISQETCEGLTEQPNRTTYSGPETFRAYFSNIDEEHAKDVLDFVKNIKWNQDFNVNFFNIFRLTEFGSEEKQKTSTNYITATVNKIANYNEPANLLPNPESHMKDGFWLESLPNEGEYSVHQTVPFYMMVHRYWE